MAVLGAAAAVAQAQTAPLPSAPNPFVEEQRQQERERALRQQQERAVDSRLQPAAPPETRRLAKDESPCFRIERIVLDGELAEDFQGLLAAAAGEDGSDNPLGRCLGTEGVNIVLTRLQQAAVARGYVTTRVLAAPQDLSQGTLALTLIPGRIAAIRFAEGSDARTSLASAIPARPGDLLNLRDIEQGLENLKRAPTAEADIQIEPAKAEGARPGDSDLVVKYSQRFPLRTTLSLDDGGTKATGKTQAGATVAWDNPLGLNDLFYVSANHDAFNHSGQGTSGQTVHYSVPYGYWLFGATASQNRYHQTVQGADQDYVYAGESGNAELKLSRLVYRDQRRKTTLSFRGFRRSARNFIDDTEIEVQRRVTAGWELGLAHREFIGQATLDANLAYRRGTGAFGALAAPEELFGEGTSRFRLVTAELGLNVPFALGAQKLRYAGLWRGQWNRTPLTPQDRFSIGGRYSVRGFDGEASLMGEHGWLLRNDIGWALGTSGAELYVGIDYGRVGGLSTGQMAERHLSG
ncbi:ShlB/FhaC/HecB family hemolysin secretion/activation protein, partial [Variovorax sp. MHTC-1]|uniref:ShlB/FhaC/HecB family hemolysin secretion/activation protein n=1 Tax=Variovorax sp. MHTC-1 TaxID=2495593 RepID=UPI00163C3CE3